MEPDVEYVLYATSNELGWPAVRCTTDMIPKSVLHRQSEYGDTAIFRLQKNDVCWVKRIYLQGIVDNLGFSESEANKRPGFREALKVLLESIADSVDLQHWKTVIAAIYDPEDFPSQDTHVDTDSLSDYHRAVQESLRDFQVKEKMPNRDKGKRPARGGKGLADFEADADDEFSSSSPSKKRKTFEPSSAPLPSRAREVSGQSRGSGQSPSAAFGEISRGLEIGEEEEEEEIDEEIMPDKNMATWFIGAEREKFYTPITAVTEREHLMRIGILTKYGNRGNRVYKPSFDKIKPRRFAAVAEFLSTGDFSAPPTSADGRKPISRDLLVLETMVLYLKTWKIAVFLSLDDLMLLIVEKMKALQPWPLQIMLPLARKIYKKPSIPMLPIPAELEMKKFISSSIATEFFIPWGQQYDEVSVDDSKNSSKEFAVAFKSILYHIPELARDIFLNLAEKEEERMKTARRRSDDDCSDDNCSDDDSSDDD